MKFLIGLFAGGLFGLGLVVSEMVNPARILGFLDVFGHWDPSLAFVMMGAIAVHAPFIFGLRRRGKPLLAAQFSKPPRAPVDARLVLGAALFGVGWGIAGYCPGPALVASTRSGSAAVLALSMLVGMWLHDWLAERATPNGLRTREPARVAHAPAHGGHQ